MHRNDKYDKAEQAEEDAQIIRSEIQRLFTSFRKRNGGATISRVAVVRGKVNLSVTFPKSWRPFHGYNTKVGVPKRRKI